MLLTSFGRVRRMTERAAQRLSPTGRRARARRQQPSRSGRADRLAAGALGRRSTASLHAIAFAPEDALGGRFMTAPAESALQAFQTSAFSFKALAAASAPLMPPARASSGSTSTPPSRGRSTTGWASPRRRSSRCRGIWPAISGRAGSASTSSQRGPLGTVAARGIPGFEQLAELWRAAGAARLGRRPTRGRWPTTICFLLSDYARAITGEIVHVDGGFHAVGAPAGLRRAFVRRSPVGG